MHFGGAGIGEADVNAARDQGPHQTFRTVHYSTPVRDASQKALLGDQSSPAPFVKGFAGIGAIAQGVMAFLPQRMKIAGLTGSLLAKSRQLWPVSQARIFFARKNMTRAFASLFAAMILLAGAGHAYAQGFPGYVQGFPSFDSRDIMGGGPNFSVGASSPIPRQTVRFESRYTPGTILIDTAERRLYLVLPNGQALRYGIGVGRGGFRMTNDDVADLYDRVFVGTTVVIKN